MFDTGIVPDVWLEGNIIPIYKNKGNNLEPSNYRPITLLSCLGKLFTSIINAGLLLFADEYEIFCENQSGFRKDFSTIDK